MECWKHAFLESDPRERKREEERPKGGLASAERDHAEELTWLRDEMNAATEDIDNQKPEMARRIASQFFYPWPSREE